MQRCLLIVDVMEIVAEFVELRGLFAIRKVCRAWYYTVRAVGEGLVYPFLVVRYGQRAIGGAFYFETGRVEVLAQSRNELPWRATTSGKAQHPISREDEILRVIDEVLPKFVTPPLFFKKTCFVLISENAEVTQAASLKSLTKMFPSGAAEKGFLSYTYTEHSESLDCPIATIVQRAVSHEIVHKPPEKTILTVRAAAMRLPPVAEFVCPTECGGRMGWPDRSDGRPGCVLLPDDTDAMVMTLRTCTRVMLYKDGDSIPPDDFIRQLKKTTVVCVGETASGRRIHVKVHDLLSDFPPSLYVADNETFGFQYHPGAHSPNRASCPWIPQLSGGWNQSPMEAPWLLWGGAGTYSSEHEEPEGSMVWVHVFHGEKEWFVRDHSESKNGWGRFVQRAGETVVVPKHLGHMVRNLSPCLAVAKNFFFP